MGFFFLAGGWSLGVGVWRGGGVVGVRSMLIPVEKNFVSRNYMI